MTPQIRFATTKVIAPVAPVARNDANRGVIMSSEHTAKLIEEAGVIADGLLPIANSLRTSAIDWTIQADYHGAERVCQSASAILQCLASALRSAEERAEKAVA